jgi:hypothetical protein
MVMASADKITLLEDVYGLIDLIIYKKYLDSIPSSHVAIPTPQTIMTTSASATPTAFVSKSDLIEELHALAQKTYHIANLDQLEKEMDTYCLTKLRIATVSQQRLSSPSQGPSTSPSASPSAVAQRLQKDDSLLKATKGRLFDSFEKKDPSSPHPPLENRVVHLLENSHLYEEELKDRLGIVFSFEQSEELTQAKHEEEDRRQWYLSFTHFTENVAFYGVLIGLPVIVMSALLKN